MLKPVGDRLLVKIIGGEYEKFGVTYTMERNNFSEASIEQFGNGVDVIGLGVKKNDIILVGKHVGLEFKIKDLSYKLIEGKDILAIMN